jgi:hypothetical protein
MITGTTESCALMKAELPTLTLAGWEHIASAADNVRLPTRGVATEPQQADHVPSGLGHSRYVGLVPGRSRDPLPVAARDTRRDRHTAIVSYISVLDYVRLIACTDEVIE